MRALRFTAHAFWSHQRAILIIGLGFGLLAVQQATQFKTLFGNSPADRAAAIAGMQSLSKTFAVLIPPPVRLDTVAGFIDWRLFGAAPFYLSVYTLIAGAAVLRGEEERGLVEVWLGAGLGRATLVVCRVLGFSLALAAAAMLAAAIAIAGTRSPDLAVDATALGVTTFLVMLPPLFFFALSLLLAQVLPSRRAATSLVGGIAAVTFVVGNLSFLIEALRPLRWLSPFYYFDEGHALAEGATLRPTYLPALIGATLVLTAASALVFARRDVNSPLLRHNQHASADPHALLPYPGNLVLATIYEVRWIIVGWTLGVVIIAALDTASLKPILESFGKSATLRHLLAKLGGGARTQFAEGFLSFAVFVLGATLVAMLVINIISHFAADQEERRVELELAQPVSVSSIHVARYVAMLVAVGLSSLVLLITVVLTARVAGIDLGHAHIWAATLMILPLSLAVGSLGAAMLPRFSRQAVGVLSAIVGLSYLLTVLGSLNGFPDWAINLSLIKAYGSPAVQGVDRNGLLVLLALIALGTGATALQARSEMTSG